MKLLLTALVLLIAGASLCAGADVGKDDQLKAAFLYNFLKFVDWPADKMPDNNEPVIIGIYGGEGFAKAFEPIKDKTVDNRQIAVREFSCIAKDATDEEWNKLIEMFGQCHILFFAGCPDDAMTQKVIDALNNKGVLTVGQDGSFIKAGGNINFLIEENKLRFEINLISAKKNNLKIRSNLLKLAKTVIDENRQ